MHKTIQAIENGITQGKLSEARGMLNSALKAAPQDYKLNELSAFLYLIQGQKLEGIALLKKLSDHPNCTAIALYELGSALIGIEDWVGALSALEKAYKINPDTFEILHDLGTAYASVGRKSEAIEMFNAAAKLNANSSVLFYNIGRLYDDLFMPERANACYRKSLDLDPQFIKPKINLGLNLNKARKFNEGLPLLEEVLVMAPDVDFIFGDIVHAKMKLGLWKDFESDLIKVLDGIKNGRRIIHPFHFLSLIDDPHLQQSAAEIYAKSRPQVAKNTKEFSALKNTKIKVAYFSADFQNHPITHLTAELYELHDTNKFEIYAFSSGLENDDAPGKRVQKAFHEFIDITTLSDEEVLTLARSKGIDIAVDLGGYTENSRIGVFEKRVAPVQVSYLGYLGTLGSPCMDYILADREVIPPESRQFFSEKIAYLPNCYQINDRKRTISDRIFTRSEFGLPDKGFIFCCFNYGYKITPEVFASWCRILQRVDQSVLWIYESNKGLANNLREEAKSRGVSPDRIIFSGVLPVPEYLARYQLADLFLDTFPYNAGTTTSDALWVGLPVLTRSGKTFSSRMAGSILKAIAIPELITYTIADYEDLAVELATNGTKLDSIRKKISANKISTPLFNSPQTAKNIEKAYQMMYTRYLDGKSPENIDLD